MRGNAMKWIALAMLVSLPVLAGFAQVSPPTPSPQASPAQPKAINLALLPYWNKKLTGGYDSMNELLAVIDNYTSQDDSLAIEEFPKIYEGATLMMPLKEAVTVLGLDRQPVPSKQSISFPGIPFFFRTFTNPDKSSPFNILYLVTDAADRLVAVQLVNETPYEGRNRYISVKDSEQKTYNFVNNRKRAVKTLFIETGVKNEAGGKAMTVKEYEAQQDSAKKSAAAMAESRTRMLETNATAIESTRKNIEKFEALIADLKKQIEEDTNDLPSTTDEAQIANLKRTIKQNERNLASYERAISGMQQALANQEANYAKQADSAAQSTPAPVNARQVNRATLRIDTTLVDVKRGKILEEVQWYVPRRIANFISYCLNLHLEGTPRQVGVR